MSTNGAKTDKNIVDILSQCTEQFGMSDAKVITGRGEMTMPQFIFEISYSAYASNRLDGMTHEQLVRIGLGNDAMKDRFEKEHGHYALWHLSSVGSIIDNNLIVYPSFTDGRPDRECGTPLDDCEGEWFDNLSIHDRNLIDALKLDAIAK